MAVSADEVRRVAALVRLEVGENEIPALQRHFNDILEHFEKLQTLDLRDEDPFAIKDTPGMPLREDVLEPWTGREEALDASRGRDGDFFKVPKMGSEEA